MGAVVSSNPILFFDGHCNLCNGLVDWLMRRSEGSSLLFASLQGDTARSRLGQVVLAGIDPDTVIYLRHGHQLLRSDAILAVIADLGGVWKLARCLTLIPRPIRNGVYGWVARNRFRLFGRKDTCRVPTPAERDRLLP